MRPMCLRYYMIFKNLVNFSMPPEEGVKTQGFKPTICSALNIISILFSFWFSNAYLEINNF